MQTTYSSGRRTVKSRASRAGVVALLLGTAPFALAACGNKKNNKVETAITEAQRSIDSVVDSVTDGTADEGSAKDLANQVLAKLQASPSPGEPLMTSINDAAQLVVAPNTVTGVSDDDSDGKDDDAKFTVETNGGNDKACVQSQNGAWEVTDDEC